MTTRHRILTVLLAALLPGAAAIAVAHPSSSQPLPQCEWCGADEAPKDLRAVAVLAGPDEPGDRLVITGTVYEADGRTPAPGVLVYAYHTNAAGIYPKHGNETGNGRRHGYLRGWLRTDSEGRYRIETIRPGTYPTRDEPAHIHMTVTPPGGQEDWIDSVMFTDDPLLEKVLARLPGQGGPGVVRPRRDGQHAWHARRDIVLGR